MPDGNSKVPYLTSKRGDEYIVKKQCKQNGTSCYLYRVKTRDRREAHKLSALIQNLLTNDIKTYTLMQQSIYNPLSLDHLQQSFIDKHKQALSKFNDNLDENIEIKLQKLQQQKLQDEVIVKNSFNDSLKPDHVKQYDFNKLAIESEFELLDSIRRKREQIAKVCTNNSMFITDYGDIDSLNITESIVANILAKPRQRKILMNGRFIKQSDVIGKADCGRDYRLPKLAGQHYLEAKQDIEAGVFIGAYNFRSVRKSKHATLHPHPIVRAEHNSYGFSLKLYPVSSQTFRDAHPGRLDKKKTNRLNKLIKQEEQLMCQLGYNPRSNNFNKVFELTVDPHCHFQGTFVSEGNCQDRLMTLMNDCRKNIELCRTAADKLIQNVDFVMIQVRWWPVIMVYTTKRIPRKTEISPWYGDSYSNASIAIKCYKEMEQFVATVADKCTKSDLS